MCWEAGDEMVCFGWMGQNLKMFEPTDIEGDRDYKPNLLTSVDGVETPKEFVDTVDEYLEVNERVKLGSK